MTRFVRAGVAVGFVLALLESTGDVRPEAWQAFLDAGFDRAAALEVVLGIATYTLTTFANRLTEAPLERSA